MSRFRALLSVSDKSGLVEFARALHGAGGELVASGGTARAIAEAGIPITEVADVTHFPEILGGRVKTLHPAIHGGILARRTPQHLEELDAYGIEPIDLVVVNLYPFGATVSQANVTLATAIEEIDIGGVALLRAAAKNHESVTVVCEPVDYAAVGATFAAGRPTIEQRRALALKAFRHTAAYDAAIAAYLAGQFNEEPLPPDAETEALLPLRMHLDLRRVQVNRYGENPHQRGGLYGYAGEQAAFEVLQGKEMSYNNWLDLDSAWLAATDFSDPTVAIIKHGNPCGLASAPTPAEAWANAYAADSLSAFGGVAAINRTLDLETVRAIGNLFLEVIAAPAIESEALAELHTRRNLRVLRATGAALRPLSLRSIVGGVLAQQIDRSRQDMDPSTWQLVSKAQPTAEQLGDLAFAWRAARHVKSNAIVYVKSRATLGVGAGQMSRVDSVMLAGHKAGARAAGAVLASDAFFPFADGIHEAAKHGIAAIVQPGGSVRDSEVIDAADSLGLVMLFTGYRHFRH